VSQEDKGVTNALQTNGWHPLNNFLLAFYTSNDFHQSTSSKELELYTWPVLKLLQKKYMISGWIMGCQGNLETSFTLLLLAKSPIFH
jgi:hypothetical protein